LDEEAEEFLKGKITFLGEFSGYFRNTEMAYLGHALSTIVTTNLSSITASKGGSMSI
jgi:hypothetical protein